MTILEEIECDEDKKVSSSYDREKYWIDFYRKDNNTECLNKCSVYPMSEETIKAKARATNLLRYGVANGAGGLPRAYNTNRSKHSGVL